MKSEYFQGSEKKTRAAKRHGLTVVKRSLCEDHEQENNSPKYNPKILKLTIEKTQPIQGFENASKVWRALYGAWK